MIGQLHNPCNVLVRIAKEEDFISVMATGNFKVHGISFRVFHWTPEYVEDEDASWGSCLAYFAEFAP